ncbi:hypothetical protein ACH5RR_016231 [Cinchona calisaya]|uniref:DUF7903 domain-containing protein n=1 Tax=Cinchona calisaya TaxID=153742 RepID=A0ABD2ZZ17_9GENT
MAYIPPHKRHSIEGSSSAPPPTPESLSPHFKRSLYFNSFSDKKNKDGGKGGESQKISYAQNAVSKWFPVGLSSDSQLLSMTRLEPISVESFERKSGGTKPLSLVLNHHQIKECSNERSVFMENQWEFVAENVKQDLLSAFRGVENEMKDNCFVEVKPILVARFGRILFHGGQSTLLESTLKHSKRTFYTNVSASYTEYIVNEVGPKLGDHIAEEKEVYLVRLSDNRDPDSTISCKCTLVKERKKLELYKIEWNQVRHLVADVSCLDKNLDLRLMLFTKRIVKALTADEIKNIKCLIASAILDPDVKGGLRWPLGTDSSGDRYAVVGVWHASVKSFRNPSIRLKVRNADRFDFLSSYGEVSREVVLKMPGIVSHLQEHKMQDDLFTEMLRSNLKLIWDNFLCFASIT